MRKMPRSVDAIVGEQVHRWTLEQQGRRRAAEEVKRTRPVLAISRQFGALGAALARQVASALHYSFWDRDLLGAICTNSGTTEQILNSVDERRRNGIAELVALFADGDAVSSQEYHVELARVVHTIASHGNAVIVGRGAQYLLEPDVVLRVRAVCELTKRIKGLMGRSDMTEDEARRLVKATDADRRRFIRQHFDRDCDDPIEYDLVINTGRVPLHMATDMIVAACRARFGSEIPG